MSEAFGDAALRHWFDGLYLEADARFSNADQLFGIAAECAIKAALTQLPGCAEEGVLARRYREHVETLWDRVSIQGVARRFPLLGAVLKSGKPFADWSVERRYEPSSETDREAAERHREAAKRLLGSVALLGSRRRS